MKVVIIIAGSCRPRNERCVENIEILKKCFSGIDFETVYVSHNSGPSTYIKNNCQIDNLILLKDRSEEYIWSQFPKVMGRNAKKGWYSQPNIYKYRQKIKVAIDFVKETIPDCTHICLTRPCLRVEIDPRSANDDSYNVIHFGIPYVDDTFGFSTKEIFYKMWDYGDRSILQNYKSVDSDEELVRLIANKYDIKVSGLIHTQYQKRPAE